MPRRRLADLRRLVLRAADLATCDGCTACHLRCAAGVPMSRAEYRAVVRYQGARSDGERGVAISAKDRAVDLGDGVAITLCRFLDMGTRLCSVYPARPLVCRLLGQVSWMPCPIGKVAYAVDDATAIALMHEYAAVTRRTYEEWAADQPPGSAQR